MKSPFIKYTFIPGLMSALPRPVMDLICPSRLILPYYHMVSDEQVDHTCNLYQNKSAAMFKGDLEFLLSRFKPVSLSDLMKEIARGSASMPEPSFHLTFDDGFREMNDVVAPILQSMGIPATFVINSAYTDNRALCHEQKASILAQRVKAGLKPGALASVREKVAELDAVDDLVSAIVDLPYSRNEILDEVAALLEIDFDDYLSRHRPYLDSGQVKGLINSGFTIGSHSIDHVPYGDIGIKEQVYQTIESTRWVRETFGLDYGAFAFPYTDRPATPQFFSDIRTTGLVDVSFGTGGMVNGRLSFHMNRFSLEKPLLPAAKLVRLQYAKKVYAKLSRNVTGRIGRG